MRTHLGGTLGSENIDQTVTLCGWVYLYIHSYLTPLRSNLQSTIVCTRTLPASEAAQGTPKRAARQQHIHESTNQRRDDPIFGLARGRPLVLISVILQ